MAVPESITDSVAGADWKVISEGPAQVMLAALQSHTAHQNRVNVLAETALSQNIKALQEVDPIEAVSVLKTLTGDDTAQKLANLIAALSQNQQGAKIAQTTPPETGKVG